MHLKSKIQNRKPDIRCLTQVEAIYFDLDDTLVAYWDASKAALKTVFEQHGPADISAEQMVEHWASVFRRFAPTIKDSDWYKNYLKTGEPTRFEQMRLTLIEAGIEDPALAQKLSDAYALERDRSLKLFPEVRGVLEALRTRYPMGLITNGPADIQRQEIETTGVARYFQHILIEGELGWGKPQERVFRHAEELMGKSPDELLFVGNSYRHDILPAIHAGWRTAWVRRESDAPPGVPSPPTLLPPGEGSAAGTSNEHPDPKPEGAPEPDATIGSLTELLGLLGAG